MLPILANSFTKWLYKASVVSLLPFVKLESWYSFDMISKIKIMSVRTSDSEKKSSASQVLRLEEFSYRSNDKFINFTTQAKFLLSPIAPLYQGRIAQNRI